MFDESASKARVNAARKTANELGAEVLGWNDKPNKEFVSIQFSDDDTGCKVQKALEADGWHLWPADNQNDSLCMDFGLQTPPAPNEATKGHEAMPSLVESGVDFHFRGPSSCFLSQWLWLTGLVLLIILVGRHTPAWTLEFKLLVSFCAFLMISAFLLFLNWLEVSAESDQVNIRKHFFGASRKILLSNFKKIQIYTDRDRRGRKTKFTSLAIDLKVGKSFNVFLPKRAEAEFYSFVQKRITPGLSEPR